MRKVYTFIIICTVFICTLSFCPVSAFQEDSFNSSQYEQIGSLGLGHLVSDGQISELDFSNGSGDTGFLVALGKAIVTKDPTYVLQYGLDWAKDQAIAQLQSLNNWFASNFPRLYDFFTGSSHIYSYNPMPLETRKGFTHLLNDRVTSPDPVQPAPDVNYVQYIELINGTNRNISGYAADYWLGQYNIQTSNISSSTQLQLNPLEYTLVNKYYNYNISSYPNSSFCYYYNNYSINASFYSEPITIYLNNTGTSYILTTSTVDLKKAWYDSSNGLQYFDCSWAIYNTSNNSYTFSNGSETTYPTLPTFQYQGTLENCFKVIVNNFRNVDIYVDGNLWATGGFSPDNSVIYPIGIPNNFEILSGVQGGYYYPTDSYWNLDGLVQLIKQAITEYGVISINDIDPLIVDINGVQAVRTTNVARTDYDNLISEQYFIYPDSSVLQVPDVVLDNGEIVSYVAKTSGSNLIPDDIMIVLCAGGVLTLIGYLINRMLE